MTIVPAPDDRGVVVFLVWPSLSYRPRVLGSFALIAAGLAMQLVARNFFVGVVPLLAGNLLLLVRGYDNRVDFGSLQHDAHWERVEPERLESLQALDTRIRRWDRSALDITNPLGATIGVVLIIGLAIGAFVARGDVRILLLDALVLLAPHWVTGVRSVLRKPKLLVRVDTVRSVLDAARAELEHHHVDVMMLLQGSEELEEAKLPEDVKIKVDPAGHHPDFLGLYGQVVINDVQGRSYPYFYVVLVAKDGFGLERIKRTYQVPSGLTVEFKRQDEVEVFVLRQHTTKTSGYETKSDTAIHIFREGLALAAATAAP